MNKSITILGSGRSGTSYITTDSPSKQQIKEWKNKGYSFYFAVLRGYKEQVLEDIEIKENEEKAIQNKKDNKCFCTISCFRLE